MKKELAVGVIIPKFMYYAACTRTYTGNTPDLPGSNFCANLSVSEIHQLTDSIIAKSNEIHDLVASVCLEKSLEKTEKGELKIYLNSCHVSPILEYCKIGCTRKSVAVGYWQRCGSENLSILENLVKLRHRFARLLGYSNYADYVIEPRMAKTSFKVFEFLEEVSNNLTDVATTELNFLKDLKMKEDGDTSFGMEDLLYYIRRAEELQFNLDLTEARQYFPVDLVLSGIFKLLYDLFGLKFKEVKDVEVWHETVVVYAVLDFSSNEILGYVYLDMFSRPGKFAHTCVLSLQNGSSSFRDMTRDNTKSISTEMCKLLKSKRDFFFGLKMKQEILICLFDQIIHSSENIDIVELVKDLHPKVMLGIPLLEGIHPASMFPRSAIGYDGTCYSQIWSEVFAADIFATKFQEDLLNHHTGLQFRNKVLAPGGSKDPFYILSDYLGRKPSICSFFEIKARNSLPFPKVK